MEIIKENSDFLRHPLIEQLATPETFISEDAAQLYKFHGGYQQDDREKRSFEGKFYIHDANETTGWFSLE